jgi:very-short-patch-repair endonuclease
VLKAHRLAGHKFVRQHPVGPYFVDFAHRQFRLAIEVDGSQHVESLYDQRREEFLLHEGWSVLRFWSGDVLRRRDEVCEMILMVLAGELMPIASMDLVNKKARGPSPSIASRCPPLP